jgi:hypothetical protein
MIRRNVAKMLYSSKNSVTSFAIRHPNIVEEI